MQTFPYSPRFKPQPSPAVGRDPGWILLPLLSQLLHLEDKLWTHQPLHYSQKMQTCKIPWERPLLNFIDIFFPLDNVLNKSIVGYNPPSPQLTTKHSYKTENDGELGTSCHGVFSRLRQTLNKTRLSSNHMGRLTMIVSVLIFTHSVFSLEQL